MPAHIAVRYEFALRDNQKQERDADISEPCRISGMKMCFNNILVVQSDLDSTFHEKSFQIPCLGTFQNRRCILKIILFELPGY